MGISTDGSAVSVIVVKDVTKCWAKFLNRSEGLTYARSPSKPVLIFFFCLYILLFSKINLTSQRNYTFNTQFLKLISICCKFSPFEEHVTKYCCYVMQDRIGHVAKYRRTCIRDSTCMVVKWWEKTYLLPGFSHDIYVTRAVITLAITRVITALVTPHTYSYTVVMMPRYVTFYEHLLQKKVMLPGGNVFVLWWTCRCLTGRTMHTVVYCLSFHIWWLWHRDNCKGFA